MIDALPMNKFWDSVRFIQSRAIRETCCVFRPTKYATRNMQVVYEVNY